MTSERHHSKIRMLLWLYLLVTFLITGISTLRLVMHLYPYNKDLLGHLILFGLLREGVYLAFLWLIGLLIYRIILRFSRKRK